MNASSENTSEYSDQVWSRFRQPPCSGQLNRESEGVVTGISRDAATGHTVQIWLQVEGTRIVAARFKAFGCPVTIAAASLAAETLEGESLAAAQQVSGKSLIELLAAPVEKISSGLLVEDALRAALNSVKLNP